MATIPESEADWRFATLARVKGDQVVQGSFVKDRTLLWLTTVTADSSGARRAFPTPSPAALALGIAIEAARTAAALRSHIEFSAGGDIAPGSVGTLYTFFEQSMAAAVFSFQSIEAYANQVISRLATAPMDVPRRNGVETLDPDGLERRLGTDEKVHFVLPKLLNVPSPKGGQVWARYRELKSIRDSTVHLKSEDHYIRGRVDRESVYHRLLTASAASFPRAASHLIRHFCAAAPERWLELAEQRLKLLRS